MNEFEELIRGFTATIIGAVKKRLDASLLQALGDAVGDEPKREPGRQKWTTDTVPTDYVVTMDRAAASGVAGAGSRPRKARPSRQAEKEFASIRRAVAERIAGKPRKAAPPQLCPVPGCRNRAAPIFGMVCSTHKAVSKKKIAEYRKARRAKKAGR